MQLIKSIVLYVIVLTSFVGCATLTESLGTELRGLHYGYGDKGEFYYLEKNDRTSDRFYELAEKYMKNKLAGK